MSTIKPLTLDIVSDVVCPWCYIGKHRIESALALVTDVPVEVHWRPFFLNPWVPREGIGRDQQHVALAQRHIETFGQTQHHVARRRGSAGYNEAEMTGG
ncbi:MAG: DsbA family protein, partial [Rhizobiales bacterium]|nr:DsbA family protein [Hyphomicrobiales bacterium]